MVGGPIVAAVIFDWTISLGQIVNALIVLAGALGAVFKLYARLDKRVDAFELRLDNTQTTFSREIQYATTTLADHAGRMERWESTLFKVVSDLQRVIGRMEIKSEGSGWEGPERRGSMRD
jgi:hypothetical protein